MKSRFTFVLYYSLYSDFLSGLFFRMNKSLLFLWLAFTLSQEVCSWFEERRLIQDAFSPDESMQVFKPLNPGFHFTLEPTSDESSTTTSLFGTNDKVIYKRQKIDQIKSMSVSIWDMTSSDSLELMALMYNTNFFSEGAQDVLIYKSIQILNEQNLRNVQRIYLLAVLWVHQDYLLSRNSPLFRTLMHTGGVSRAGLELSLVKGFDLILELEKALKHPDSESAMNPYLLGVLQRVELLDQIRRDFGSIGRLKPSKKFQMIHDDLLQSSFPIGDHLAVSITNNCIESIVENQSSKIELRYIFQIMKRLGENNNSSKAAFEIQSSQNSAVKAINEEMIKWEKIKTEVKQYVSDHGVDPYIASILIPFLEPPWATLDHYQYIVRSFKAQMHAEAASKAEEAHKAKIESGFQKNIQAEVNFSNQDQSQSPGLEVLPKEGQVDAHSIRALDFKNEDQENEYLDLDLDLYIPIGGKYDQYIKDKEFILKLMYKASPYVKNSKEFLGKNLRWIGEFPQILLYAFQMNIQ
ncbi:hypothetical protein DFH28DRAFT_898602 [Melampsora americana]|nr:hypothetical protein DFH28DRAFT_898602 [Melampsora americana]